MSTGGIRKGARGQQHGEAVVVEGHGLMARAYSTRWTTSTVASSSTGCRGQFGSRQCATCGSSQLRARASRRHRSLSGGDYRRPGELGYSAGKGGQHGFNRGRLYLKPENRVVKCPNLNCLPPSSTDKVSRGRRDARQGQLQMCLQAVTTTTGGGGRNRTAVRGFAGPCLNHSATPPRLRTTGGQPNGLRSPPSASARNGSGRTFPSAASGRPARRRRRSGRQPGPPRRRR